MRVAGVECPRGSSSQGSVAVLSNTCPLRRQQKPAYDGTKNGRVNLAPLYDLSSALLLPTRVDVDDLPFAMTIAGRRHIGSIDQTAWTDLAKDLRLDKEKLLTEVRDVASAIDERLESIATTAFRVEKERRFAARFVKRVRARAKHCSATVM